MDSVFIQVKFSAEGFSDALYFTPEEWEQLTPEDIEAKKQERIDAFIAFKQAPPAPVEPTKEELLSEKQDIEETIQSLIIRKEEIEELTKEE